MNRKRISYKTKCASLLLQLGHIPYDHAKRMTEDQIISLYQLDHNIILHSSEHDDRDKFWNLEHKLIQAHREKTKQDAKIIAKGRRIRKKLSLGDAAAIGIRAGVKRVIRPRGFDKRYRRLMSGKVVPR